MRERFGENFFYQLYFQAPGVAEHELQHGTRTSMRRFLYSASRDAPARAVFRRMPASSFFLEQMVDPGEDGLAPWLTTAGLDFFTSQFEQSGFRRPLNWYRNIDRNWELLAPFTGARVTVPALYVAGDRDLVVRFRGMDRVIAGLENFVPQLRGTLMLGPAQEG